jgi:hypothetical protein
MRGSAASTEFTISPYRDLLIARVESLYGLRRRRLLAVELLNQDRVANVLLFVSEKFAFVINRCHSRDASATDGVRGSI